MFVPFSINIRDTTLVYFFFSISPAAWILSCSDFNSFQLPEITPTFFSPFSFVAHSKIEVIYLFTKPKRFVKIIHRGNTISSSRNYKKKSFHRCSFGDRSIKSKIILGPIRRLMVAKNLIVPSKRLNRATIDFTINREKMYRAGRETCNFYRFRYRLNITLAKESWNARENFEVSREEFITHKGGNFQLGQMSQFFSRIYSHGKVQEVPKINAVNDNDWSDNVFRAKRFIPRDSS